jgi:hypothetical protein
MFVTYSSNDLELGWSSVVDYMPSMYEVLDSIPRTRKGSGRERGQEERKGGREERREGGREGRKGRKERKGRKGRKVKKGRERTEDSQSLDTTKREWVEFITSGLLLGCP